jgi:pilus assembly protein CpaC
VTQTTERIMTQSHSMVPAAGLRLLGRTLLAVAAGAAAPAAWSQAVPAKDEPAVAGAPCSRVQMAPAVQVGVGKSTVVRPAAPVARVLLGNPEGSHAGRPAETTGKDDANSQRNGGSAEPRGRPGVADVDVLLLSPVEVYLLGRTVGTTNVVLLDRSGQCTAFDVVVSMDTSALQLLLAQLLPAEKDVRVASAYDSLVLTGTVSDAGVVSSVMDLANAYVRGNTSAGASGSNPRIVNLLSTGAPQQVMLEVKVAEVSKALLDQFGINFSRAYVPGDGSMLRFLSGIFGGAAGTVGQISGTGPGVPKSSVDAVVGGAITGSGANAAVGGNVTTSVDGNGRVVYTTTYGTVPGRGVTNAALNMQKTDGLVRVLAEPTVMAISGKEGRFNAGGKIYIPVAQRNEGTGSTVTLEEKEFGVSVRFRPTVMDAGRINLEMLSEVSELNREGVGISAPGVGSLAVLPAFSSRKVSTTVQLMDGQSFAVGGLIKNSSITNIKAFPLLGELPVIGALFRSTEFQSDKSELVFVVTPRLVKPLPPDYQLPTDHHVPPTRSELIWQGRLEGRAAPAADRAVAPAPAASAPTGFQVK